MNASFLNVWHDENDYHIQNTMLKCIGYTKKAHMMYLHN